MTRKVLMILGFVLVELFIAFELFIYVYEIDSGQIVNTMLDLIMGAMDAQMMSVTLLIGGLCFITIGSCFPKTKRK